MEAENITVLSITMTVSGLVNDPENDVSTVCTTFRQKCQCYSPSDTCTTNSVGALVCSGLNCTASCSSTGGSVIFSLEAASISEELNINLINAGAELSAANYPWIAEFGVTPINPPTVEANTAPKLTRRSAPPPSPPPPTTPPPPRRQCRRRWAGTHCGCEEYLDGTSALSFADDICSKKEARAEAGKTVKKRVCKGTTADGACPNSFEKCKAPKTTSNATCADESYYKDKYGLTCAVWGGDSNSNSIADCNAAEDTFWEARGFKSKDLQAVRKNCPLSCGACGSSSSSGAGTSCFNKKGDGKCKKKADKGKCSRKKLKKKCEKTCGVC